MLFDLSLTGETSDASIKALRSRQMKNFHLALMVSQVELFDIHLTCNGMLQPNFYFACSCT